MAVYSLYPAILFAGFFLLLKYKAEFVILFLTKGFSYITRIYRTSRDGNDKHIIQNKIINHSNIIIIIKTDQMYKELESEVLRTLGLSNWNIISYIDECITVKSRQTLEKYDKIRFFKENKENLARAEKVINKKSDRR